MDARYGRDGTSLDHPRYARAWPAHARCRLGHGAAVLNYILTILSSGRPVYLERTLASYAKLLSPPPSAVYLYDDGRSLEFSPTNEPLGPVYDAWRSGELDSWSLPSVTVTAPDATAKAWVVSTPPTRTTSP